jgi:hypothetical protein
MFRTAGPMAWLLGAAERAKGPKRAEIIFFAYRPLTGVRLCPALKGEDVGHFVDLIG